MRSRTSVALAVGLVLVLLLGAGLGLGWIDVSAILRGDAEDAGGETARLEGAATEDTDPTLAGRAEPDAVAGAETLPPPVDLDAVDRTRDLHGVVVREDGTPVPGAFVQALTHPWRNQDLLMDHGLWDVEEGPHALSAVDGTFRLRLEPGALVALFVRAKGFASVEQHLKQAGERVRVVLHEPVRIRVVVRGPGGEPVEGTALRLFHRGGRGHQVTGVTDAEGVAVLADLEPGRNGWIDVRPPRFGYPGWVTIQTPAAGEETTVEVDLEEGRTLVGRVTDAATGEGIEGARVGMNWVLLPEVRTDAEGSYELPGWTGEGVKQIDILAEGYAREAREVGEDEVIDVALTRVPDVVGRVLDEEGKAVAGARVHAIGTDRVGGANLLSVDDTRTGRDGRFRLTGLTPGLMHTLVVVAPGYGRTWRPFLAEPGDEGARDLGDVVLPPGRAIAGVVVDVGDVPLPGVELEFFHGEGERFLTRGATLDRATDDLGRFVFPDLSPGTYTLRLTPPGGVEESRTLRLGEEDLTDVRVVVGAQVEVAAVVRDESGAPVAGAYVSFQGRGRQHAQARTDADGRAVAQVPAAEVSAFSVSAFCPDRDDLLHARPRPLGSAPHEIEIVLRAAMQVRGRLQTADGTPLPGLHVSARREDDVVAWAITTEEGTFRFRLEPGPHVDLVYDGWTSGVRDETWRDFMGRVDDVALGATDVVLTVHAVAADRFVEVRVLDPDGHPVEGAVVGVPFRPGLAAPPQTDATGTYRIEGLRHVETPITAFHRWSAESPWMAPPAVNVVPDGQLVVVHLLRARELTVRVTGLDASAAYALVRIVRSDGTVVSYGGMGQDGSFRIPVPVDETEPLFLVAEGTVAGSVRGTARRVVPPPGAGEVTLELRAE